MKSKKIEEILKILKEEELTAPQIAKRINTTQSYVYQLLYRLEAMGQLTRRWEGAWVWKAKDSF